MAGPGGIFVDFGEAFGDIDGFLVVVTALVVAFILVLVYRSPVLPLVVLVGAALALGVSAAVVYGLVKADVITLNGQSQGILLILVFGASTDYALLRGAVAPIVASAVTVILGVLCLLFSDLNSIRGLGPVSAIGIAASLLVQLTDLPAALTLLGRGACWPRRPKKDDAAPGESVDAVDSVAVTTDAPPGAPAGVPGGEPKVVDGLVLMNAVLGVTADGEVGYQAIRDLRAAVGDVGDGSALVGGFPAINLDTQDTAERDLTLIIPIVLLVVFVVLVALGIDYNIFLMTRVREEALRSGTRPGILAGLRVTGGVITAAGVVLAATFAALGVIPILSWPRSPSSWPSAFCWTPRSYGRCWYRRSPTTSAGPSGGRASSPDVTGGRAAERSQPTPWPG